MSVAQLYLSPSGRIGRQTWWLSFFLPALVLSWGVAAIDYAVAAGGMLLGAWYLAILWPSLVLLIKRWHDADRSAWWLLIVLVPILGALWNFIQCGFLQGTSGPNRFGPSPLAGS